MRYDVTVDGTRYTVDSNRVPLRLKCEVERLFDRTWMQVVLGAVRDGSMQSTLALVWLAMHANGEQVTPETLGELTDEQISVDVVTDPPGPGPQPPGPPSGGSPADQSAQEPPDGPPAPEPAPSPTASSSTGPLSASPSSESATSPPSPSTST